MENQYEVNIFASEGTSSKLSEVSTSTTYEDACEELISALSNNSHSTEQLQNIFHISSSSYREWLDIYSRQRGFHFNQDSGIKKYNEDSRNLWRHIFVCHRSGQKRIHTSREEGGLSKKVRSTQKISMKAGCKCKAIVTCEKSNPSIATTVINTQHSGRYFIYFYKTLLKLKNIINIVVK